MITYQRSEQSKLTNSHLLGFMLNDEAYCTQQKKLGLFETFGRHLPTSIPLIKYWNSGQMNALPAYAASTCNQTSENKLIRFKIKKIIIFL